MSRPEQWNMNLTVISTSQFVRNYVARKNHIHLSEVSSEKNQYIDDKINSFCILDHDK